MTIFKIAIFVLILLAAVSVMQDQQKLPPMLKATLSMVQNVSGTVWEYAQEIANIATK